MHLVIPDSGRLMQTRIQCPRGLTDNELRELSEQNQGVQVEWLGKERMLVMSPTGFNSGWVSGLLYAQVAAWARKHKNGKAIPSDVGFRLPDDSVLSPDVAWVSNRQLEQISPADERGFIPLCPELIIEVKSPSDTIGYLRKKCRRWITAGAKAALLVDPEKKQAELFLPGAEHRPIAEDHTAIPGFPGLEIHFAEAWEDDSL